MPEQVPTWAAAAAYGLGFLLGIVAGLDIRDLQQQMRRWW